MSENTFFCCVFLFRRFLLLKDMQCVRQRITGSVVSPSNKRAFLEDQSRTSRLSETHPDHHPSTGKKRLETPASLAQNCTDAPMQDEPPACTPQGLASSAPPQVGHSRATPCVRVLAGSTTPCNPFKHLTQIASFMCILIDFLSKCPFDR